MNKSKAQPCSVSTAKKSSHPGSKQRPAIYQVLPRLYGNTCTANIQGGTLEENGCGKMNDFTLARLRRIRRMGFTHIWFTGLLAHATKTHYPGIREDNPDVVKGQAGSPYAIKDYYDIDPDLAQDVTARMSEFEALVARTHQAGMGVIIDFVPNHVAREYHGDARPKGTRDLGEDDDTDQAFSPQNNFYYLPGETLHTDLLPHNTGSYIEQPAKASGNDVFSAWPQATDWYETVKLNYGVDYLGGRSPHFSPTPSTWLKMVDILRFWADKGVDAFRCDMAEMVPVEFWHYAIAHVKQQHPELIFIAEVYNPQEYSNYIHNGGFDYLYDKVGLYDTLRRCVRHESPASDITFCWQQTDAIQHHLLHFLENHDEQRIASPFFASKAENALPALLVSATIDDAALMVYAGQEIGEKGSDIEGFSGYDGRTTIFDYWSLPSLRKLLKGRTAFNQQEKALYDTYSTVIQSINGNAALRQGQRFDLMYCNYDHPATFNPTHHYALLRSTGEESVLLIANFTESDAHVSIRIPKHAFDYLGLSEGTVEASDLLTHGRYTLNLKHDKTISLNVPAHGGLLLSF